MIKVISNKNINGSILFYIALTGNKRKSRRFYYSFIGYRGVEFTSNMEDALFTYTEEDAKFLLKYIENRIKEVGLHTYFYQRTKTLNPEITI